MAQNDIDFDEAAILNALPSLRALSARGVSLRAADNIVFASLERLRLFYGFCYSSAPPHTYARAFPSLRFCAMELDIDHWFPAFPLMDFAVFEVQAGCAGALANIAWGSGRLTALQLNDAGNGDLSDLFPAAVSRQFYMPQVQHLRLLLSPGPHEAYLLSGGIWEALPRIFPNLATFEIDMKGSFINTSFLSTLERLSSLRRLSIRNAATMGGALC